MCANYYSKIKHGWLLSVVNFYYKTTVAIKKNMIFQIVF